jgi:hypothetical protein
VIVVSETETTTELGAGSGNCANNSGDDAADTRIATTRGIGSVRLDRVTTAHLGWDNESYTEGASKNPSPSYGIKAIRYLLIARAGYTQIVNGLYVKAIMKRAVPLRFLDLAYSLSFTPRLANLGQGMRAGHFLNVHRNLTAIRSLWGTILVSCGLRISRCHPRFHTMNKSFPGLMVQRKRVFVPTFCDSVSY